jgi:Tol biopolymer transport system component/tetratricopeptide (TPR) repeat protein
VALTNERPEIAGAAHYMLATITLGTNPDKAQEHTKHAEEMLPETAEAYSLRAMAARTSDETLRWLRRALTLDPTHYPSLKAQALAYYTLRQYQKMSEDAAVLVALRPRDSIGYLLRAIARRELGQLELALEDHGRAIALARTDVEVVDAYDQRRETHMTLAYYEAAAEDARRCTILDPNEKTHRFNVFSALLWARDYERAQEEYEEACRQGYYWHLRFRWQLKKLAFDTLASGQELPLSADIAVKAPFYIIQEAAECYQLLSKTATRLIPRGVWLGEWSPDSRKIAFARSPAYDISSFSSLVPDTLQAIGGKTGIEILDLDSGKRRLITTSGVCPRWSPDGRFIAFSERHYPAGNSEVWVTPVAGGPPRKIATGHHVCWSPDSRTLFFRSLSEGAVHRLRIDASADAAPTPVLETTEGYPRWFTVSPDGDYLAHEYSREVSVVSLASQSVVSTWQAPWPLYGWILNWLSEQHRLVMGSSSWYSQTGAWVLDIETSEARQILPKPGRVAYRSPDRSRLLISVLDELWIADVDPDAPITEVFGSAQTEDQFLMRKLQNWTQYIQANPSHAELYLERALTYIALEKYDRTQSDLDEFARLFKPSDKHLFYMICWWGWQYCTHDLFEGGEVLMSTAAKLNPQSRSTLTAPGGKLHPGWNLVSLYEKWGKPELAEKWRARLFESKDN